jgi:hypothetical protein
VDETERAFGAGADVNESMSFAAAAFAYVIEFAAEGGEAAAIVHAAAIADVEGRHNPGVMPDEDRTLARLCHISEVVARAYGRPRFLDAMRLQRGPVMLRIRRFLAMPDKLAVALDRLAESGNDEVARELLGEG